MQRDPPRGAADLGRSAAEGYTERMSSELITAVEEAIALLESWRGRFVHVEVTSARGTGDNWEYDRHIHTHSQLAFVVQHVGWRFSGSALFVHGAVAGWSCGHEVSLDALVAVRRLADGSLALKERYGRAAERVSVFRLVASAPDAEPGASPDPAGESVFPDHNQSRPPGR